jgi:hypothetical protein
MNDRELVNDKSDATRRADQPRASGELVASQDEAPIQPPSMGSVATLKPTPRVSAENALAFQGTLGNAAVSRLLRAQFGSEQIRPALHPSPVPASSAPASTANDASSARTTPGNVHGSAESLTDTLDPVDTEDEKTNYLSASTPTLNDLTPTGSSGLTTIKIGDVDIQGEVFDDSGSWKIRVTSASTTIHWGINTSGYTVPDPRDGGNITAANWKTVVDDLKGYEARQASGSWHHPDASRVHEMNHVTWFRDQINATWPGIESAIQAKVLGSSGGTDAGAGMSKTDAETAMRTFLDQKRRDWFNAYGVAPEPPAYAAGQVVLNGIIAQIQTYVHSKGWDSAPDAGAP